MEPKSNGLIALSSRADPVFMNRPRPLMDFFNQDVRKNPERALRNIFLLVSDAMLSGIDETDSDEFRDEHFIGYGMYDASRLLTLDADIPFFPDRHISQKLHGLALDLRSGNRQNKIYILRGAHGSGKTTLLNNLLRYIEAYTNTEEGAYYQIHWKIQPLQEDESSGDKSGIFSGVSSRTPGKLKDIRCPHHCHPVTIIPKDHRTEFLKRVLDEKEFQRFAQKKEYDWIWRWTACPICTRLYRELLKRYNNNPEEVINQVYVTRYVFERQLGEGITVYNPGDPSYSGRKSYLENNEVQDWLNKQFGDSQAVQCIYSSYAATNNGIYVLMDVEGENERRFDKLHNIISEGTYKVGPLEEKIVSLFVAVQNPESTQEGKGSKDEVSTSKLTKLENKKSFQDRKEWIDIPYARDAETLIKIFRSVYGEVDKHFLPGVLENFARIIISTRISSVSPAIANWLGDPSDKYERYCGGNVKLLKMEIVNGRMPAWLSHEDRRNFTPTYRRMLIEEWDSEEHPILNDNGKQISISGRASLKIFRRFLTYLHEKRKKKSFRTDLATMEDVYEFFVDLPVLMHGTQNGDFEDVIESEFLDDIAVYYDYQVLQQVKEAMYYYNQEQISRDVLNYLWALSYDLGDEVYCCYTGDKINVSDSFFGVIEDKLFPGVPTSIRQGKRYDEWMRYTSQTLSREINVEGKKPTETEQYKDLFGWYEYNLKQHVLEPFKDNDNFVKAIEVYGTDQFDRFDERLKRDVERTLKNLMARFNYTLDGAKEICFYIVESRLFEKE